MVLPIFTAAGGHLGSFHPFSGVRFWLSVIHYISSRIENRYKPFVIFLGGEVVYRPVYIAMLTFWRPSWTPSWILKKAPAGITGSFSMIFLMVFGRFPEKFSLGIFFSPLKPNTIRLKLDQPWLDLIKGPALVEYTKWSTHQLAGSTKRKTLTYQWVSQ